LAGSWCDRFYMLINNNLSKNDKLLLTFRIYCIILYSKERFIN